MGHSCCHMLLTTPAAYILKQHLGPCMGSKASGEQAREREGEGEGVREQGCDGKTEERERALLATRGVQAPL